LEIHVRLAPPSTAGSAGRSGHRSHHVNDAGHKAKQKEHDEPERRRRQQMVDTPADRRSNKDAGNQLRRKPKTECHGRSFGRSVFALPCGLVSSELAVVTEFGQPLVETSEPCGKRGLVGRFIATSISAAVRAFRHVGDPTRCHWKQKLRPITLKSRADHTYRTKPSQDSVFNAYVVDSNGFLSSERRGFHRCRRLPTLWSDLGAPLGSTAAKPAIRRGCRGGLRPAPGNRSKSSLTPLQGKAALAAGSVRMLGKRELLTE